MDLFSMLQGQLSDTMVKQLSQQIGTNDTAATAKAATGVVTTLMGALAQNAATPQGAASLANALEKDHDGSVLNNLMSLIGGGAKQAPAVPERALNGAGIISHILGDKQNGAVQMISQMSGLNNNQTGSLMTMLAPMVMGLLGQQKRQQGLDVGALAGLLMNNVSSNKGKNPLLDMATRFLDKNGDGRIVDDLIGGIGKNLLGNLFKKK